MTSAPQSRRPSEDDVRQQLGAILASSGFRRAPRLARFLTYVVEAALDGRDDEIQEYLIGLEVFDRRESFDPRSDSIVRAQGVRLRERLAAYYAEEGKDDRVVITLASRGYAPEFRLRKGRPERMRPVIAAAAVAIGLIAAGVAAWRALRPAAADADLISIGVLPFETFAGAADQRHLADGLTDGLINDLGRVASLRVISRTTMMSYRGANKPISEIAQELGLDYAVEGIAAREGSDIRADVRLLDAQADRQLLVLDYHRPFARIESVHREAVLAIARALEVELSPAVEAALAVSRPVDAAAYEDYLKGIEAWHSWTPAGARSAIQFFRSSIEQQADFAAAKAWLATAMRMVAIQTNAPGAELLEAADRLCEGAVRADPSSAFARFALATNRAFQHRWAEAEEDMLQALEMEPSNALFQHGYANNVLLPLARFEEAEERVEIAIAADPANPIHHVARGFVLSGAGRLEQAVGAFEDALALAPNYAEAERFKCEILNRLGRPEEAIDSCRTAQRIAPNLVGSGMLAGALAAAGHEGEAQDIGDAVLGDRPKGSSPGLPLALAALGSGDEGAVLDWLEYAVDHHEIRAMWLAIWPGFERFYDSPRFARLIERMDLEEAVQRRRAALGDPTD